MGEFDRPVKIPGERATRPLLETVLSRIDVEPNVNKGRQTVSHPYMVVNRPGFPSIFIQLPR